MAATGPVAAIPSLHSRCRHDKSSQIAAAATSAMVVGNIETRNLTHFETIDKLQQSQEEDAD
jgi:hypothetical protein